MKFTDTYRFKFILANSVNIYLDSLKLMTSVILLLDLTKKSKVT